MFNSERRYSLRKLSVGLASVCIGLTLFGGQKAKADSANDNANNSNNQQTDALSPQAKAQQAQQQEAQNSKQATVTQTIRPQSEAKISVKPSSQPVVTHVSLYNEQDNADAQQNQANASIKQVDTQQENAARQYNAEAAAKTQTNANVQTAAPVQKAVQADNSKQASPENVQTNAKQTSYVKQAARINVKAANKPILTSIPLSELSESKVRTNSTADNAPFKTTPLKAGDITATVTIPNSKLYLNSSKTVYLYGFKQSISGSKLTINGTLHADNGADIYNTSISLNQLTSSLTLPDGTTVDGTSLDKVDIWYPPYLSLPVDYSNIVYKGHNIGSVSEHTYSFNNSLLKNLSDVEIPFSMGMYISDYENGWYTDKASNTGSKSNYKHTDSIDFRNNSDNSKLGSSVPILVSAVLQAEYQPLPPSEDNSDAYIKIGNRNNVPDVLPETDLINAIYTDPAHASVKFIKAGYSANTEGVIGSIPVDDYQKLRTTGETITLDYPVPYSSTVDYSKLPDDGKMIPIVKALLENDYDVYLDNHEFQKSVFSPVATDKAGNKYSTMSSIADASSPTPLNASDIDVAVHATGDSNHTLVSYNVKIPNLSNYYTFDGNAGAVLNLPFMIYPVSMLGKGNYGFIPSLDLSNPDLSYATALNNGGQKQYYGYETNTDKYLSSVFRNYLNKLKISVDGKQVKPVFTIQVNDFVPGTINASAKGKTSTGNLVFQDDQTNKTVHSIAFSGVVGGKDGTIDATAANKWLQDNGYTLDSGYTIPSDIPITDAPTMPDIVVKVHASQVTATVQFKDVDPDANEYTKAWVNNIKYTVTGKQGSNIDLSDWQSRINNMQLNTLGPADGHHPYVLAEALPSVKFTGNGQVITIGVKHYKQQITYNNPQAIQMLIPGYTGGMISSKASIYELLNTVDYRAIYFHMPNGYDLSQDQINYYNNLPGQNKIIKKDAHTYELLQSVVMHSNMVFDYATMTPTFTAPSGETPVPESDSHYTLMLSSIPWLANHTGKWSQTYTVNRGLDPKNPQDSYDITKIFRIAGYKSHVALNTTDPGADLALSTFGGVLDNMKPYTQYDTGYDVTYTPNKQTETYTFVDDDENGKTVGTPTVITGNTDTSASVSLTVPANYSLAKGQKLPTGTYTFKAVNNPVTIHLVHQKTTTQELLAKHRTALFNFPASFLKSCKNPAQWLRDQLDLTDGDVAVRKGNPAPYIDVENVSSNGQVSLVQTIVFTRTKTHDKVTNADTYSVYKAQNPDGASYTLLTPLKDGEVDARFSAIKIPQIPGYTAKLTTMYNLATKSLMYDLEFVQKPAAVIIAHIGAKPSRKPIVTVVKL